MTLDTISLGSEIRGLGDELKRQLATKRDLMADTRRVSFAEQGEEGGDEPKPGLSLLIDLPEGGSQAFDVTDHAHQQIGTHLGIPSKLYDKLAGTHPDLFTNLVNGLFSREPAKRMFRTMDGKARAFLSDRYRPRDNWDLLDQAVLPALSEHPGRVEFKRCDLTETRMYIKIVLPEFERPVTPKVGDVIRGGVIVQNSEVGAGSLGIYPYTDRLICTNGMVHVDLGQRQRHVGKRIESEQEAWEMYSDDTLALDDAAFFAKCRDTIKGVLNETVFDAIVSQMQELAGIKIDSPPDKVIEVLANRHQLRESEQGSMLTALIAGADLSGWGYVNSITQTARDLTDADRQTELETLAGRLVSNHDWALVA